MARLCSNFVKFVTIVLMFTQTESQLTLESVNEGPCSQPEQMHPNLMQFLSFLFRLTLPINRYYMPVASKHMVRWYAQNLLGRPAESQEELDQMELRITGSLGTWYNTGYPDYPTRNNFLQQGFFTMSNPFSIFRFTGVNGVMKSIMRGRNEMSIIRETIMWSDYRTSILFYRCADGEPDWKLVSLNPTVSDDVRDLIVSKVVSIGFNASMIEYIKY